MAPCKLGLGPWVVSKSHRHLHPMYWADEKEEEREHIHTE